jgi:hypothetical protein
MTEVKVENMLSWMCMHCLDLDDLTRMLAKELDEPVIRGSQRQTTCKCTAVKNRLH